MEPCLKQQLRSFQSVSFRALLNGSVQLWAKKVDKLGCEPIANRGNELFLWNNKYDPDFLGIMSGVLEIEEFLAYGGVV